MGKVKFHNSKQIICTVLSFVMLSVVLCGCSKISQPSDGDFMLACDSVGLSAVSQSTTGSDQANMEKLYIAQDDNDVIEFMQYDNETSAQELFASITDSIKSDSATVEKNITTSTYSKYFIRNGDKYQAVIRVGKVVIYGKEITPTGYVDSVLEYLNLD